MLLNRLLLLCAVVLLTGCATTGAPDAQVSDPLESLNRKVLVFNDVVDDYLLLPVARTYDKAAPLPVRVGVSNFFGNLEDLWTGANNLLQGKPTNAASDAGRVLINSTIGILGFFDVASEIGLDKHSEDFGQTLGVWGMTAGPYLELPLLGPRTLRDAGALFVDSYGDPLNYAPDRVAYRNWTKALRLVDTRRSLLGSETTLKEASTDKYVFRRNFYLSKRQADINDGRRPRSELDFE